MKRFAWMGLVVLLLPLWGCGAVSPPPTPTPAPLPTATPLPTPVPTHTPSPPPTATPPPIVGAIYDRPGEYVDSVTPLEWPRQFKVHVPPSYQSGVPTPLVFNLHGLGSNIREQEAISAMSALADRAGFIVVYPQAGAAIWNVEAGDIGAVDVNFFRMMIEHLEGHLSIDPRRIYVVGFSNGGAMAHRLACDLSDRIAAAASVSGPHVLGQPCEPARPVPVLELHGAEDEVAPYFHERRGYDVAQWAADWAARNGCHPQPEVTEESGVRVETWSNCQADAAVVVYLIDGMGHNWPGSPVGHLLGPGRPDVPGNEILWAFFQAHPLP